MQALEIPLNTGYSRLRLARGEFTAGAAAPRRGHMNEHDLPELDARLRALLAIESDPLDPPDGAFERVFERVGQSAEPSTERPDGRRRRRGWQRPQPGPSPSPGPTSAPGADAALTQAAVTTARSATAATVPLPTAAGAGVPAGARRRQSRHARGHPCSEVRVEERVVERVVEVPVRWVEIGLRPRGRRGAGRGRRGRQRTGRHGQPHAQATPPVANWPRGRRGRHRRRGAGSGRDRDLADENALVPRAQAALARGRTSEALAATSEHQRRFAGEFAEEREALAIQALACSGNLPAAMARAERLRPLPTLHAVARAERRCRQQRR
ncbi:MAG: hypothetical protein IPH72_27265 [Sandaracinaceae bacterium]|nr:hypothetical protein [Sandaracinaceae bacterium]